VVGTSVLRQVVTTGRRLTLPNRHAISARCGLILSGAAGTGKTTAITQLGKTHEATDRARQPGRERIPVIYVTVPPAATPRMLAMEFARFLGLPIPARTNMTDVIEAVCGVAIDTSVTMVLVDEIHNMQLATRSGAEVSDTLKYLSERIPATFVYAGMTWSARACSPASGEARSPAGSRSSPRSRSRSPTGGGAWSPLSRTPSASAATRPGPWPGSTATSASSPGE
jgi:hypothetical protein